jgi:phage baseplate assembly protein W
MSTTAVYGKPVHDNILRQIVNTKSKVYGLGFPSGSKIQSGYFFKQAGLDLVRNNLKQLLKTELGERVMLPNFGISLQKYLFQPMDQQTFEDLVFEVQSSITKYATGVRILKIRVFPNQTIGLEDLQSLVLSVDLELKELENQIINLEINI